MSPNPGNVSYKNSKIFGWHVQEMRNRFWAGLSCGLRWVIIQGDLVECFLQRKNLLLIICEEYRHVLKQSEFLDLRLEQLGRQSKTETNSWILDGNDMQLYKKMKKKIGAPKYCPMYPTRPNVQILFLYRYIFLSQDKDYKLLLCIDVSISAKIHVDIHALADYLFIKIFIRGYFFDV